MQQINHKERRHILTFKEKNYLVMKTVRRSLKQNKIIFQLHDKNKISI